ncbi:glycosyltransferase family 43 protein [Cystobasidium minutum MCA 4210]|uniref:glycosyltransferase family 43 protein n=1 Tax=Cystobasidium minutum MCA 4210 TaxID=1397322 RepID=UPI0034CDFEB5|eukprot:jgi/Rhomi1/210786/estExt_Genemark1.C_4_t10359
MVSRRGSRTPLVAILSVAGTILFFRYAFSSSANYDASGPNGFSVNASYNEYLGGKARLLAEQLVMNKGPLAAAANRKQRGGLEDGGSEYDGRRLPVKKYTGEVSNEGGDWAPIKKTNNGGGIDPVEFYGSNDISGPVRLCPDCDCTTPGAYANSPAFFTPIPKLETLRKQISKNDGTNWNSPGMLRYLLHKIQLHSVLEGLFLTDEAVAWLLTNQFTCPDMLISYNFTGLAMDKPTSYIYTRTGPGGKLAKWTDRAMYMERHVGVIHEYEDLVKEEGFLDGAKASDRQLLWLVVEDESQMEPGMEELLRASGIPYLYMAHGPTRHYGKAQWNIVLHAIAVLRDSFFGDGPVLNVDDDCRILPEILRKMWKVKRAIVWQVGNYPARDWNSWWEGPVFEKGKLKVWQHAWLPNRVFPIDLNGFAVNSSEIGVGRAIAPPQYIPFDRSAGETEFLEKVYQKREDIEPLCEDTKAEKCYYTWHNSWLKKGWKDRPAEV